MRLEKRKRANQPVVCLDGEISQVLHELVDNAFDGLPGGGRLLVRSGEATDWRTGRPGLVLTVTDTGTGIALEYLARIGDAFFTTTGIGGIGLGLWISADIVQRNQGRLRFRSRQGSERHGTAATLFLPFACAVAA